MCLIVCKPIGRDLPGDNELKSWFNTHPDGMGMMFNTPDNKVHILKGAMNIEEMLTLHTRMVTLIKPADPKNINIVYHFRQATHGSVKPGNCHPFPITKDKDKLRATEIITDRGIVHNGVIWDYGTYSHKSWSFDIEDDLSDTQSFIIDYLADMGKHIHNKGTRNLIATYTDSRFAVLDSQGIDLIGEFIKDKGLYFSNGTYKTVPKPIVTPVQYQSPLNSLDDYSMYDYYQDEVKRGRIEEDYCDNCGDLVSLKDLRDTGYGYSLCGLCYKDMAGWMYEETPEPEPKPKSKRKIRSKILAKPANKK
jgi:predicted glutamine amidotransferase